MRLYTLEEARETLPRVVPVLQRLRGSFVELRALQAAVEAHSRGASGDGNLIADPFSEGEGANRVDELNRALRAAAARLNDWGIEVKDPERGLIDFYSRRGDEVVFLCYELGEETITHWHSLGEGYAGRQPVE